MIALALPIIYTAVKRSVASQLTTQEHNVTSALADRLASDQLTTQQSLSELKVQLAKLQSFENITSTLSNQLQTISATFSSSNLIGQHGEQRLQDILEFCLPTEMYATQKMLSNGKRVDVQLNLPSPPGPISVDSKFPLQKYRAMVDADTETDQNQMKGAFIQAVKEEINKIAQLYIRPPETSDFALMFVPLDAISIEIQKHQELIDLARQKRVFMVSPSTLMATVTSLRSVLQDMKQQENIYQVRKNLESLLREVESLLEATRLLGVKLSQAESNYSDLKKSVERIGLHIENIVEG